MCQNKHSNTEYEVTPFDIENKMDNICMVEEQWHPSDISREKAAEVLSNRLDRLKVLTAEGKNFASIPINKKISEVEETFGAIVWNSYEALLKSNKNNPIEKYSGPNGKYSLAEENLCIAIQRLSMGIFEIRNMILHGSQDQETIKNMKFIVYRATIEHMQDTVERSNREKNLFPTHTPTDKLSTLNMHINIVKAKTHEFIHDEDYENNKRRSHIFTVNEDYDVPEHVHDIRQH